MIVTRVSDNSDREPTRGPAPAFTVLYDAPRDRFLALGHGGKVLAEVPSRWVTADRTARLLLTRELTRRGR